MSQPSSTCASSCAMAPSSKTTSQSEFHASTLTPFQKAMWSLISAAAGLGWGENPAAVFFFLSVTSPRAEFDGAFPGAAAVWVCGVFEYVLPDAGAEKL